MNKRVMIIGILAIALLLLLTACDQKEKSSSKKKGATATNQTGQQSAEIVKPVDVASLPEPAYSLVYCNKRLTETRDDLQRAQDNLADEQDDLRRLQAETKTAERDAAISSTNAKIRTLTSDVSGLQRGLQSMENKCKEVTPRVCAEFLTDAQNELNDLRQELLNEQRELEYIRDSRKQELQRRKVLLFERRVIEWTTIAEELQTSCK